MKPLSHDISRCTNKECELECRRKEPSDNHFQSYFEFIPIDGKCYHQIELNIEL
ncbi:MAG: hypothetical protein LBE36_13450 [Flavobacteriaceae bacterium]|jgi:hypothetical protein|nr:hypothetical protein [Flavobacteriaceae bacterium]